VLRVPSSAQARYRVNDGGIGTERSDDAQSFDLLYAIMHPPGCVLMWRGCAFQGVWRLWLMWCCVHGSVCNRSGYGVCPISLNSS